MTEKVKMGMERMLVSTGRSRFQVSFDRQVSVQRPRVAERKLGMWVLIRFALLVGSCLLCHLIEEIPQGPALAPHFPKGDFALPYESWKLIVETLGIADAQTDG